MKTLIFLLIFASISFSQTFKSSEYKTPLIELYTSQGCSSCPPADKWLSSLKDEEKLFKEFIPLAFHVTYWDFLGWKDKFANIKYDIRQREYSKIWNKNSLYTPQFTIDAKEYRKWFYTKSLPTYTKEYGGILKATLNKEGNLSIEYTNKKINNKEVTVNIALLGMNYSIPIKRGENAHKILRHDFVVLKHLKKKLAIKDSNLQLNTKINLEKDHEGLVVWISDKKLNQYQAVATYIE
jgi:hypothetical protein